MITFNCCKLYAASITSRYYGAVYIKPFLGTDSGWYGRIEKDGRLTINKKQPAPFPLAEYLADFAENPVNFAAEHGRKTGKCCFCHRTLTDDRSGSSVDIGYGPICAKKWNLPHLNK